MAWASSHDTSGSAAALGPASHAATYTSISSSSSSSSTTATTATRKKEIALQRDKVMAVFCRTASDFASAREYNAYLERAEGIVFRILQNQDKETAQLELEEEKRRVGSENMNAAVERRRADDNKRKLALAKEPTWGLGLPSKRQREGSAKVDLDRANRFQEADEKRRKRLTTGEGDEDSADPKTVAERKQRNKERAGGYDHKFDAQHGRDEVAQSIACFR